jgi:hypothetical protein
MSELEESLQPIKKNGRKSEERHWVIEWVSFGTPVRDCLNIGISIKTGFRVGPISFFVTLHNFLIFFRSSQAQQRHGRVV